MCRNIRPLFNFEPPATEAEIRASALQFVRKVSGFAKPSQGQRRGVRARGRRGRRGCAQVDLIASQRRPAARPRDVEARKARERSRLRFG